MAEALSKTHLPSGASDSDIAQLTVLKVLLEANPKADAGATVEVDEIALRAQMVDEKETLRCLYILEGQKLVSPEPSGDLTSRKWAITPLGVTAARHFGI